MTFNDYFQQVLETLSILGYSDEVNLEKEAEKAFNEQISPYEFAESVMSDKSWFGNPIKQQIGRALSGSMHIRNTLINKDLLLSSITSNLSYEI